MTTPFIEVIDAIRELLEPSIPTDATRAASGLALDLSAARPFEWQPETLYVWEDSRSQVSIGTGEVREDFLVMAAYVARADEESVLTRGRSTSEALDTRTTDYMDKLRNATGRAGVWAYMTGASVPEYLRQFEVRGTAIRISGYRLLTD